MFKEAALENGAKRFQREIRAYRKLLDAVQDVPDLSRVEHHALAFLVEEMRAEAPNDFERIVEALIDELLELKRTEGIPGVTRKLSQEFNRRYAAFVSGRSAQEPDPVRKENLGILLTRLGKDMESLEEAYNRRARVPIGSVVLEHLPPWFEQM